MAAAGALWAFSMMKYNRRFFRINGNAAYLLSFGAISAPVSYTYANFFLSSGVYEAGVMNNAKEASAM